MTIFGAGDDARPLVEFGDTLGWHVTVADGRANLARAERFPQAAQVGGVEAALTALTPDDAAVVMTHSYEQDRAILLGLLAQELRYIGVLGPRARTERLVNEVARELGLEAEGCLGRLALAGGAGFGRPRAGLDCAVDRGGTAGGVCRARRADSVPERRPCMPETGCAAVVLAAGASTRLGKAKQLIRDRWRVAAAADCAAGAGGRMRAGGCGAGF